MGTVPAFFTAMPAAFQACQGWVSVGYIEGLIPEMNYFLQTFPGSGGRHSIHTLVNLPDPEHRHSLIPFGDPEELPAGVELACRTAIDACTQAQTVRCHKHALSGQATVEIRGGATF